MSPGKIYLKSCQVSWHMKVVFLTPLEFDYKYSRGVRGMPCQDPWHATRGANYPAIIVKDKEAIRRFVYEKSGQIKKDLRHD
jgi:hypothetical protein